MSEQHPYCPAHDNNTDAINRMKGMWSVLLVILVFAVSGGWYFLDRMDHNVSEIAATVSSLDKTLSTYIGRNNQRTESIEKVLLDHEDRIRVLEQH